MKSELSAGSANVIAIIYIRHHGVGEGDGSPIRTCMIARLSGDADLSAGGGEYPEEPAARANGGTHPRGSDGRSMTTVMRWSSGGAFAADPPACVASRMTLSAIRSRSSAGAGR